MKRSNTAASRHPLSLRIAEVLYGMAVLPLAMAAASAPAQAADFSVATEAQLRQAIIDANNSGDPSSTITLTANITVASNTAFATATSPLTINTGAFNLAMVAQAGNTPGFSLGFAGPVTVSGQYVGGSSAINNSAAVGGTGILFGGGALTNQGTITGGTGGGTSDGSGAGRTAGNGGAGVSATTGGSVVNASTGTITGGAGGRFDNENVVGVTNAFPGIGGAGVVVSGGGSLDNRGTIVGGAGGAVINFSGSADNLFAQAGGAGVRLTGGTHLNSGSIRGGASGIGWNIGISGHGDGGSGAELSGGATLLNSGTLTGENGRAGGGTTAGTGSLGGVGALVTGSTLENTGTIIGGNAGGTSGGAVRGGVAVSGSGATVINAGTLTAGLNADGSSANAIQFTGGTNRLELRAGSTITGNAVAFGAGDTLALGGATDASLAVSTIGAAAQYRGFGLYQKTGTSTWTLTGTTTATTPWTLLGGTLSVAADGALGAAGGALSFNGGTLQVTGTGYTSTARTINWGAGGGSFDIADAGNTFTLSQSFASGGALNKLGDGALVLTGTHGYTGGTTISAGTLRLGNGGTTGALTGDVVNNGTFAFNRSNAMTFAGAISGTGSLSKQAANTLTLTGTNTYTGLTTIDGGTLQIGNGGTTGSIVGDVVDNGALVFNRSNDLVYSGLVSGSGTLSKLGTGTLTLDGASVYSGGTTIGAGTLQLGNGGTTGSILGDVTNNGTLAFNRADAYTFAGLVSGTGALDQRGAGTTVLTAANTYGGGTTVSAGTLQLGDGGTTGSILGNVANSGTLAFNRSDDTSFAGIVSGSGVVSKLGGNTLTLTGNNTYTGTTTIAAGALQVGAGGTTGAIVGNVLNDGTLIFNRSDASSYAGQVSGSGALSKIGTGTLVLTGDSSYTGGTTISAGTLQLGNGGGSGSIAGDVLNNGTLAFNRSDTLLFGGVISGAGTISQAGTGVTQLVGNSSGFTGTTSVTGGTLLVNGILGSAGSTVNVSNGATLGGSGRIGGNVALADASLAPGNSPGTLIIDGNLALSGASVLDYEFGQSGVAGGALNDLTLVNGDLVLDGTLNVSVSAGGSFTPGLYRVIGYSGALTDNGLAVGTMPSGSTHFIQTSVAGQVNLINADGLTLDFWDGDAAARNNGIVEGGNGVWQAVGGNDNWTIADGSVNAPYADATFAIFTGSAGTVTVDNSLGAVVSGGMQFATDGYVLQGQAITLAEGSNTLRVGDGTAPGAGYVATLAAPLAGTGGLDKTDLGTLVLAGDNTYTGGTTISAGTLQLGNGGTTGAILGDVANNGTLAFNRSDDTTFAGIVSGGGALSKLGGNTLTLAGDNAYTGGTTIASGTLQIGDGGTSGAIVGDVANSGTLAFNRSDDTSFAGIVSGSGVLSKLGGNTLTLTGNSTYSGDTTIASGVLQLGNGGTSGSIAGNVDNGGVLAFNRADALTFAGLVSGTGALEQRGTGTTVLTADNTYSGATTISAGTLQLGNGGTTGSILGDVVNNGTLAFNRADAYTFAGLVSGTGALTQIGTGTTILTGSNTYSGGTTISAGTLQLGDGGATGSILGDVTNNGTLAFNRSGNTAFTGVVSGSGALLKLGGNTLTLTGDNTYTGGTTIAAGTLQVGAGATSGTIVGDVANSGTLVFNRSDDITFAGIVSGSGALSKLGGNTLTLTGNNTYTGDTVITSGTLQVGNGGSSGAISGNVINNGALVFNRADNLAYAGTLSGNGSLSKFGGNTLTLSGNSSAFGGNTGVSSGTLLVDGTLGSATSNLSVATGARLGGSGTIGGNVTVIDGVIAPGSSAGTLTIGGNLSLGATTALEYEFGQANTVGGPFNDLLVVGGDLVLDGTLNVSVSAGGSFDPGLYRVIGYSGTLTDNGLAVGTMPSGSTHFIQTSVAGQVNLINADGLTLNFWDGDAAARNNGVIEGGNGVWQAVGGNDNWTIADGSINAPYADETFAIFTGSAGTVTVDNSLGAVVSGGMQFATDGYVLQGQAITLAEGSNTLRVGDGTAPGAGYVATLAAPLAGTGGLDKTDLGTLVLAGDNTYTGGTTISAGTLQLGNGGTTGAILGDVTNTGTLAFNRSDDTTFGGIVSGGGALSKLGSNTLTLAGDNAYTGGTTIASGTLQIGDGGTSGAIVGDVTNTGTLAFNRSDDTTFAGIVSGSGVLSKLGGNTLTLTGNSTYSGDTTIASGVLQLGNGGTSGSIAGNIVNDAALVFNRADALSYAGAVSGSGTLTKLGASTLTLTGDSSYTGGTVIGAGMLQLGDGGTTGSILGDVDNGGALSFNRSDVFAFDGLVSGNGSLSQIGAGTTVLGRANTYTGATTVAAGTLRGGIADAFAQSDSVTVNAGATLDLGGFDQQARHLSGDGTVNLSAGLIVRTDIDTVFAGSLAGAGALTKTGAAGWTLSRAGNQVGSISVDAGELRLTHAGALTVDGDYTTAAGAGTIIAQQPTQLFVGGAFTQQAGARLNVAVGALPDIGAASALLDGELIVSGYSAGPDPLRASEVAAGQSFVMIRTTDGITGDFDANPLAPSALDYLLHEGSITRNGLDYTLGFKLAWTEGTAATSTGDFTLEDGTSFNVDLALGDETGPFDRWDGRSLVKNGEGWLVLSGQNTYTGGTTLNAGRLSVSADANLGAASAPLTLNGGVLETTASFSSARTVTVAGDAAMNVANGTTVGLSGTIGGAGRLAKVGGGALEFSGNGSGFTGTLDVDQGRMRVNGTLGAMVGVGPGATLDGTGTLDGLNARAGSTVAPGNSIGTLTVDGDATFAAGSRYQVEVDASGASDRLQVNGTATLQGGTVEVDAADGDYSGVEAFTILSATGGVSGQFEGLDENFAFLDLELGYDANNVYLNLQRNDVDFGSYAQTYNQIGAAGGAQSLGGGNGLYDAIAALPDDPDLIRNALDQISGEMMASLKSALIEDSHFIRDAANDRLRLAGEASGCDHGDRTHGQASAECAQPGLWARGFSASGHFDGRAGTARLDRDISGVLVGGDLPVGNGYVGALSGFSESDFDVDARDSDGRSRNTYFGVYGGGEWGALSVRSGAFYTDHDLRTDRHVSFLGYEDQLHGDFSATSLQAYGEIGYLIQTPYVALEPFLNVTGMRLRTDGYRERGGDAALQASAQDARSTWATAGLRGWHGFEAGATRMTARFMVAGQHVTDERTPDSTHRFIGGTEFNVIGSPLARDLALVEAGLDVQLGQRSSLGLSYHGRFGSGTREQGALATFVWEF